MRSACAPIARPALAARPRRQPLPAGEETGLKLALTTDAHNPETLGYMQYAVGQARRGWIEPGDVLNTRPWPQLKKLLAR